MDAALGSREIAAEHFVIWGGALVATPTLLYVVRTTSAYPFLRWRSLEALQMVALGDRLFFIVWAMLVGMLLVSLLWEGLYPDRTDQQILGVLPVSPRMVAAARVATALGAALAILTAIVVPTAVFYAATSGVHPVLGARLGRDDRTNRGRRGCRNVRLHHADDPPRTARLRSRRRARPRAWRWCCR